MPGARPFDLDELLFDRLSIEIFPNAPDAICFSGSELDKEAGDIEAGAFRTHNITIGPILPDQIPALTMGIRMFTGIDEWVELTFTTEPGSGVINETSTGP